MYPILFFIHLVSTYCLVAASVGLLGVERLVILLFVIDNELVKTISDEYIEMIFKSVPTLKFKPFEANISTILLLVFILHASLPKYILKYCSVPKFVHPN